jgi:hypothetical protein
MQEGYGMDKLPNDFIRALVKRHELDIIKRMPAFKDALGCEKCDDFFSIDTKDTRDVRGTPSSLPLKQAPSLVARGSQRDLNNLSKQAKPLPHQDHSIKSDPKNGSKKSKSTTEDTCISHFRSQICDSTLIKSRRASGFAPGPVRTSLVPRSDRSITDFVKQGVPKDPVCRSLKEISNQNGFNWNEEVSEIARKHEDVLPPTPPPLPSITVVSYRTQVELGLNYLIKLEVESQPFLACIWQKQNIKTTEVSRVTRL